MASVSIIPPLYCIVAGIDGVSDRLSAPDFPVFGLVVHLLKMRAAGIPCVSDCRPSPPGSLPDSQVHSLEQFNAFSNIACEVQEGIDSLPCRSYENRELSRMLI